MKTRSGHSTCKKNGLTPLCRVLSDPVVPFLVLTGFLALLGWPLLQIAGAHGQIDIFFYLFAVWVVMIGVLLAISHATPESADQEATKPLSPENSEQRGTT